MDAETLKRLDEAYQRIEKKPEFSDVNLKNFLIADREQRKRCVNNVSLVIWLTTFNLEVRLLQFGHDRVTSYRVYCVISMALAQKESSLSDAQTDAPSSSFRDPFRRCTYDHRA